MSTADASPYEVLDIPAFATESEVKKTYRKKSLLIHPDKFKHEQGPEAFDLLKKVSSSVMMVANARRRACCRTRLSARRSTRS